MENQNGPYHQEREKPRQEKMRNSLEVRFSLFPEPAALLETCLFHS